MAKFDGEYFLCQRNYLAKQMGIHLTNYMTLEVLPTRMRVKRIVCKMFYIKPIKNPATENYEML